MSERLLKVVPFGVFGTLIAVLTAGFSPAQEPIPLFPPGQPPAAQPEPLPLPPLGQPNLPERPGLPAQGDSIEVLAKGPVHEAFAATAEAPTAAPVVAKQPPDPIEELPPDQKPAGDNVQFLPGYWHLDEESNRFIWISGFWRQPPPGRAWVPGAWRAVTGGWQWASGFWQDVNPRPAQPNQVVQPEIEYLPEPPASIEIGPSVAAPDASSFYVPGSWVWRGRYVWRPGVWVVHRPDWVWVPAHFRWTPAGYVFVDGYWDYPLGTRGVLFAPVAFARPVYAHPAFVYTPAYVVSEPCMVGALFVRRGHGHYYFGDYFDNRYAAVGYSAWCGTVGRGGFTIGFGVGRSWGYDPLWSYYSVAHRASPAWHRGVGDLYGGRYSGNIVRPPATLVQQNTAITNITKVTNVTNVTNNITVVNGTPRVNNRDVSNVAMLAPLRVAPDLQRTKFQDVNADARRAEAVAARQLREVGAQRTKLETAVVNRPQQPPVRPAPGQPAAAAPPRTIKLDVPKAAVARAQVNNDAKAPPPNPLRANGSFGGRVESKSPPNPAGNTPAKVESSRTDPKRPGNPFPKFDPKPPTGNPQPKNDPRPPVAPKVEFPKVDPPRRPANPLPNPVPKADPPRNDPRPPGGYRPRVDPQLPPVGNPPKVEPKSPVVPRFDPKPPAANPLPPRVSPSRERPKSDPPRPPAFNPPAARPQPTLPSNPPPASAPPSRPLQRPPQATPPAQSRPAAVPPRNPPRVDQPPNAQPKTPPPAYGKPGQRGRERGK